MSKIKLTGENSGYVEISAGQNAGNNTLQTPTSGTRLVAHEGSQDVTLNANLTVNGVLTYDDVTNIDSVGVITARAGVKVPDSQKIFLGTGDDLQIYHDGSTSYIKDAGNGNLNIETNGSAVVLTKGQSENLAKFIVDGAAELYYDNSKKFETTSSGVKVSGSFPDFIINDTDTTNDNFRILHNGGGTQLQVDPNNVSSGSYLLAAIDGSEKLRVTSEGKVLIGSDTGSVHGNRLLQIGKTDRAETYVSIVNSTSGEGGILFADTTTNDTGGYRGQIRYHHSSDSMNFRTAATERLRIASDGRITHTGKSGAAASTAIDPLSSFILNDAEARLQLCATNGGSNAAGVILSNESKHFIIHQRGPQVSNRFDIGYLDDSSPTDINNQASRFLSITTAGLVGINCTPLAQLQVKAGTNANIALTTMSSEAAIEAFNDAGSANVPLRMRGTDIKFFSSSTERLRITSGGDLLLGGQTAYTYDDTGASNTILDIANSSNNKRGILSLSGNCNANGPSIGTIWFNNDQNSGTGPGATMKLAAAIQAKAVTSDSNAGDDSGAYLQFLTKPESAALAESMVIHSDGEVTKPRQPSFFSRPPAAYNLSQGGNTIGGTWSNVHNIGSHFSNGTFTAPIAGTYQFTWAVFSQSETTRLDAYINVNGTGVMREEITGYTTSASNKSGSVHGCYYLSANDNVTFGVYTQAGNQLYVAAAPWSYASGFLVG